MFAVRRHGYQGPGNRFIEAYMFQKNTDCVGVRLDDEKK